MTPMHERKTSMTEAERRASGYVFAAEYEEEFGPQSSVGSKLAGLFPDATRAKQRMIAAPALIDREQCYPKLPRGAAAFALLPEPVRHELQQHALQEVLQIKRVLFHGPATIVYWTDGSKTVVKCQAGDTFSYETGLAMAIAKKAYGNDNAFNKVFKKWVNNDA